jgi:RNA recognition motif-containing protein
MGCQQPFGSWLADRVGLHPSHAVNRDPGLPRGFAFVEMTNDAEAEKAIKALNGSILRDRTLDVNYARPRPERPA